MSENFKPKKFKYKGKEFEIRVMEKDWEYVCKAFIKNQGFTNKDEEIYESQILIETHNDHLSQNGACLINDEIDGIFTEMERAIKEKVDEEALKHKK